MLKVTQRSDCIVNGKQYTEELKSKTLECQLEKALD